MYAYEPTLSFFTNVWTGLKVRSTPENTHTLSVLYSFIISGSGKEKTNPASKLKKKKTGSGVG